MELKHIGRYDIKTLIGTGGMSAVYLGYDPRALREVAIKVLPPYFLHSEKFRERFEREAVMIALLEHPAIVPVYDMGEEDGQPYIVMRYMSGGSLSDKLKKGPISLKECSEMYLRLAPALDTAHARGVTHRDVKPDNLLFDKYDNVFLSDFGLARLRETIGFANISDGSILGTPAYMSPEQIQGDHAIDGRSDIYSMGVVLYQMLCGSIPFNGPTAASIMMMHLINPVPQILERNKSLPNSIQAVLEIAMAKNPDDRYPSAGEFARQLQAVANSANRQPSLQLSQAGAGRPASKRQTLILPSGMPADGVKSSSPIVKPGQVASNKPAKQPAESIQPSISPPRPAARQFSAEKSASSTSRPAPARRMPKAFPLWGWALVALAMIFLTVAVFQWSRGGYPFSLFMPPPGNPTSSLVEPTQPAEGSLSSLTTGHADKLAFLNASDIWVSNLDGRDLARLTTDGGQKAHLNWSPDGQSVLYTSDNCINMVGLQTKQVLVLTCFSDLSSIDDFILSPDGQNIALGLSGSELYLLPYSQLFQLRQASSTQDISPLSQCSYYAPYDAGGTLKSLTWSLTSSRLAMLVSVTESGILRDLIRIMDFSQCSASPQQVKEITPTYFLFTLPGYFNRPEISTFAWDGSNQLILNGYGDEAGFGSMDEISLDLDQNRSLTPNGPCCYRDTRLSPDGTYLFYSFQPQAAGDISLYYVPLATLDQPQAGSSSLTLPVGFLARNSSPLQPALRAVHE